MDSAVVAAVVVVAMGPTTVLPATVVAIAVPVPMIIPMGRTGGSWPRTAAAVEGAPVSAAAAAAAAPVVAIEAFLYFPYHGNSI